MEGIYWGHEWQWGYYKHPPLSSWLLYVFFRCFGALGPYLLGQLCVALALWLTWRLGRRVLEPPQAALGSALLLAVFYYTLPSLEFNHNLAQLPVWAGFLWAFHVALTQRNPSFWLLLGTLAGLGLIEDGEGLTQALQAKSWLAGSLAGLGGALDMADLARDPFGKLLSWGLAWVIEHFSPLKDWLNDLTGNPGEVRAFSQTWSSIGGSLNENSAVLARAVNEDMDGAEGVTIAAYRSHQTDMSRHIGMVGGLSEGMATSLLGVSVAVQVVHDLVRDRISDTVSSLAKYAVMELLSLGALTPFIIEDVASQVLHSATVLRGHIKDLFHSGHALGQLADGAKNVLTKFKNALANHSGAGVRKAAGQAPPSSTPSAEANLSTRRRPSRWFPAAASNAERSTREGRKVIKPVRTFISTPTALFGVLRNGIHQRMWLLAVLGVPQTKQNVAYTDESIPRASARYMIQ